MIEFTKEQIEKAAKIMKIIRLCHTPGMDAVAVKLNCEPTHDEIARTKTFAQALGLATRGDLSALEAAGVIMERRR